jgi:hypothetical protein
MSPTQRALADLRKLGYHAQVVERWNPYAEIRQDLFGFIDILAIHPERHEILGVQACSGASHAARRAKIEAHDKVMPWLLSGGRLEIWSYSRRGDRGCRKLWTLRREVIPGVLPIEHIPGPSL